MVKCSEALDFVFLYRPSSRIAFTFSVVVSIGLLLYSFMTRECRNCVGSTLQFKVLPMAVVSTKSNLGELIGWPLHCFFVFFLFSSYNTEDVRNVALLRVQLLVLRLVMIHYFPPPP